VCCLFLLPSIPAAPHPDPQVLFRDSALLHQASHSHLSPLGSVSHNSHSVQDSRSAVHRHHTQGASQADRLHSHTPSLVQHADGRLFAVNTNLQPGQLFQTADGRIFELSAKAPLGQAITSKPDSPSSSMAETNQESDDVLIAARDSSEIEETTEAPETTTIELVTEAPVPRSSPISQPQRSRIIATAPFTPATARFAVPAVTHITHTSPFLTSLAPSTQTIQHLKAVQAAPNSQQRFIQSVPTSRLRTVSGIPTSQLRAVQTVPTTQLRAFQPIPTSQLTAVQANPTSQLGKSLVAGRGHSLADSNTNVFTGYFSFPSAGLDFDF
jgi:hypothetical protein